MLKKTHCLHIVLLALLFALSASAEPKKIAVCVQSTRAETFWKKVYAGFEAAASEMGAKTSYYGLYDAETKNMPRYLEQVLTDMPDGLILSIPNVELLEDSIRKIVEAGIPVVAITSGYYEFATLGIKTFVGQDPDQAGREAAERMVKAGVTKLLCIRDANEDVAITRKISGIAEVFNREGLNISVLTVRDFSPSTASSWIATTLVIDREIDGVLALGGTTALAAIRALEERSLYGKIPFATFDVSDALKEGISSSAILFAVSSQPFMQGYLAMSILAAPKKTDVRIFFDRLNKLSKHNFFPPGTMPYKSYQNPGMILYTGPIFITADNLSEQGVLQ